MANVTFVVIAGFKVLGRPINVRARVRPIQVVDPTVINQERGFAFLSINGNPRVDGGTLGNVIDLTPEPGSSISYRPGKIFALLRALKLGLIDLLKKEIEAL